MLSGWRDLVRFTHGTATLCGILQIRARDVGLDDIAIVAAARRRNG